MEFYARKSIRAFTPRRFNSQWDGILLKLNFDARKIDLGFNSQWDGILLCVSVQESLVLAGFNSQWDGILLKHKVQRIAHRSVSIPNGMEFYRKFMKIVI